MKHKRIRPERETKNGWTRWVQPRMRGYLLECCDCCLVHRMDFRVVAGHVQLRAQRAALYTARERKRYGVVIKDRPKRVAREGE